MERKLGGLQVRRGITQRELAEATGISLSVYVRLEHGRLKNLPIRYLANCVIALGVPLGRVLEGRVEVVDGVRRRPRGAAGGDEPSPHPAQGA